MFKYVPTQPTGLADRGSSVGHVVCILTSVFCNDLPFVVIRLATMIVFGFLVSDMIFLLKNVFVIIFSCIQLCVVGKNLRRDAAAMEAEQISTSSSHASNAAVDGRHASETSPNDSETVTTSRWALVRIHHLVGKMSERREFRSGPEDVWCDARDQVCLNKVAAEAVSKQDAAAGGGVVGVGRSRRDDVRIGNSVSEAADGRSAESAAGEGMGGGTDNEAFTSDDQN